MNRKALLLACSLLCWLAMSGQMISGGNESRKSISIVPSHNVAIGVRGGVNSSQWNLEPTLFEDIAFASQIGWRAGVSLDVKLWRNLFLETGLYYSMKTTKLNIGEVVSFPDDLKIYPYNIYRPGYLEIPVILSAQFRISRLVQLKIGTGAYIAYGVWGKSKEFGNDYLENDPNNERNLFTTTKPPYYDEYPEEMRPAIKQAILKPFDVGLAFNAGLNLSGFHIDCNYDLGLCNISRAVGLPASAGTINKTRSFSVNLGYDFYVK